MLDKLRKAFASLERQEFFFILCTMFASFCVTMIYAISRPVSNSTFITAYGAAWFPYAWIAVLPLNYLVVSIYNKFLPRFGCFKMLTRILLTIVCVDIICAFWMSQIHAMPFVYYVWKEIYIMLLFQQIWSAVHSTIKSERAKYLYGLIYACGGVGGAVGALIPNNLATVFGSEKLLLFSIPISILLTFAYRLMMKNSDAEAKSREVTDVKEASKASLGYGVKLIRQSRVLSCILLILVFMQLTTALVDYQFHTFLEKAIESKDLRTAFSGKIFGIINSMTVALQLFGTFLLVHFLGVRGSHLFVPFYLCLAALGSLFMPTFGMMSACFISIKSVDFSIFGVIKEMLYIPLRSEEKFHAKAVIDVFAYRSAKAFASLLIIGFKFLPDLNLMTLISWGNVCIFGAWVAVIALMLRKEDLPARTALS